MKLTTSTFFTTSALIAASAAAPSLETVYQLRLSSSNSAINNAIITVKDETSGSAAPNAMGVFSTGEPRNPYTFKFVGSSLSKALYKLQSTKVQKHLVLTGNQVAMGLYDIPIGADPQPAENELTASDKWFVYEAPGDEGMRLMAAVRYKERQDDNSLLDASSWRACKGDSDFDYTLYWFDGSLPLFHIFSSYLRRQLLTDSGLNRLEDYVKGCEGGISLYIEEAKASVTTSGFLTGVTAPTATPSGYINGVTAPNSTAVGGAKPTGSSKPYEGSAAKTAGSALVASFGLTLAFVF